MSINEHEDIIDSRDIINRIDELETIRDAWQDWLDAVAVAKEDGDELDEEDKPEYCAHCDLEELAELLELQSECNYGDWHHGESLIAESYFDTYMDDMIDDCYDIPELPSFMTVTLDYDALKQDYIEVEFRGQTFFMRA